MPIYIGNIRVASTDAAGGIVTNYKTGGIVYQVHTFYGTGLFEAYKTLSCDVLIVAGGGAGGGYTTASSRHNSPGHMGGGGAGGMGEISALSVSAGAYTATVGFGGEWRNGGTSVQSGQNSSFTGDGITDMTCYGGGGGCTYSEIEPVEKDGGSGGGPDENGSAGTATTGLGGSMTYYGNNGGGTASNSGGGGGGAGGAGGTEANAGGKGGVGRNNSLQTGANQLYCEGGGMSNFAEATGWYVGNTSGESQGNGYGHGGQPYMDGSHGVVVIRYAV